MERLGLNLDRYAGETIDVERVLDDIAAAARGAGWSAEPLPISESLALQTWRRSAATTGRRIYVSAGIHGDEPAGPLAVRQLLQEDRWPDDVELYCCPCLNPEGLKRDTRENEAGIDLNRDYLDLQTIAIRAHTAWLLRQPSFAAAMCLHEDWEANGFYIYELNPDHQPSRAEEMIRRVEELCPIDRSSEIEERPAAGGIIRPSPDPLSRPQWPEAFFLLQHKTRLSYTCEAPSDYPLSVRVAALVASVRALF